MRKVNRKTALAKIHIFKKVTGMTDDEYRVILTELTGKESCADMSNSEVVQVLEHLGKLVDREDPKDPSVKEWRALVYAVARERLGDNWRPRLCGLCEKIAGKTAPDWCDKGDLYKLNAALQRITRLEKRRADNER
jgi:phage gp16-like protein